MIDLNTLISNALTAAVQQAVAPLNTRIATLESVCATQHEAMVAMRDRITALENNPAQGVDTSVVAGNYAPISNEQIKAALQEWATKDSLLEHLDNQEWFWEKLQNRIDAATESAMDDHTSTYDHDNYDEMASKVYETDFDDYVTRDSVREEIEDVLNNATLSLSI